MTPSRITRVISNLFHSLLEDGRTLVENSPDRMSSLRFSSLPLCPIQWMISAPKGLAKRSEKDFSFSYYTRVGTTVHEVVQGILARMPELRGCELVADWKCRSCGHIHKFTTVPAKCHTCPSRVLDFREVEIEFPRTKKLAPSLGHIDMVLRLPEGSYLIADIKTTSTRNAAKKDFKPSVSYLHQIRSYAAVISKKHGAVSGVCLLFIPRDNFNRFFCYSESFTESMAEDYYLRMQRNRRDLQILHGATEVEDLEDLIKRRPCADTLHPDFSSCAHAKSCVGNESGCVRLLQEAFAKIRPDRLPLRRYFDEHMA